MEWDQAARERRFFSCAAICSGMHLRNLSLGARIGLIGLVLVIWMGQAASLYHMHDHYQNRDERPGMTLDDIRSAYHGLNAQAAIKTALEHKHPEGLHDATRTTLLNWLDSGKVAENYDNLDLGDQTPAELMAASCISCHDSKFAKEKGGGIALSAWEDVRKVAFTRTINPVPIKVLAISTHTHALALGALSGVVIVLALATRRCSKMISLLVAINGLSLAGDIAGWWLARQSSDVVYLIVGAGALYNISLVLMTLMVIAELIGPKMGDSTLRRG